MMSVIFWFLLVLIAWSLFGYGLVWTLLARIWPERRRQREEVGVSATMLIAARNEEHVIEAKIRSVLAQDVGPNDLSILVVSDGSEDATLARAMATGDPRVSAFQTEMHGGKAMALNAGLARIDRDVVIFSDANSILEPGAVRSLLSHFSDRAVGGVCGRPRPERHRTGWHGKMEATFWQYDSMLKSAESRIGGAVSAQGTLYAIRRALVPAKVPEAMADDFYISTQVPAAGYRLVFDPRAIAIEDVTERTGDEIMRRVRSTERGWRGLMTMRRLLNPLRHGLYAIQLISHKLLRRVVAFFLPALFLANLALLEDAWFYWIFFLVQAVTYGVALAALLYPNLRRLPGVGVAAFFVMGHAAMAYGILRAATGVRSTRWSPVRSGGDPL